MAQNVFESLVTDGRVHRGMLGVTVQSVTSELATALDLDAARGALVNGVTPDGPAAKAGVAKGDVITAVNGVAVTDSNAVRNMVARLKPGSKAELTILREGRKKTVTATLDELPSRAET